MKHSSISLAELESVEPGYHGLLGRTYKEVTSYRAATDSHQFRKGIINASKIFRLLRDLSLGDTEREKYINAALDYNQKTSEVYDSLSYLGFSGFTTIIMGLNVKPIRDLYDSFKTTLVVKRLEKEKPNDVTSEIHKLQQELLEAGRTYVETHQSEKLTRIAEIRRNNPNITGPLIVYASGVYETGPTVNFFGEILHPNLLMLDISEETREKLREDIKSQPIKEEMKVFIYDQIREKTSDDIHHGHRLNFDFIVANLDEINRTFSIYHGRTSRRASCLPVYELEGLLPTMFEKQTSEVAPALKGNPAALNMINKYINTFLVRYGVMPLDYYYPELIGRA